jgi:hypothetical protein
LSTTEEIAIRRIPASTPSRGIIDLSTRRPDPGVGYPPRHAVFHPGES